MFRKQLIAALALMVTLGACDQNSSGPAEAGKMSVLLTDAPGDFEKAVVTIDEIYLHGSGEASVDGRVYLMKEPVTVDLLELRNEVMDLVKDEVVPGGTYSQLRLVISGGYIEVVEKEDADGNPTVTKIFASSPEYAAELGVTAAGTLKMPSYAESGLKINLPGGAVRVDGDETNLLLDFNVAESFGQEAGQSGSWVMNPVIHAMDFELTAGVEFTLSLAEGVSLPPLLGQLVTLADFQVALDKDGDVLTESFVEHDGTFRVNFNYLKPGTTYPVAFIAKAGLDVTLDAEFPETVSVTSGTTYRQSFKITGIALE